MTQSIPKTPSGDPREALVTIREGTDTRVSLVLTLPHIVGSLYGALAVFADYGVNMTEIHSRPLRDMPWNYCFYIDFDGNLLRQDTRALIYQTMQECSYVRILGSYPVTQDSEVKA